MVLFRLSRDCCSGICGRPRRFDRKLLVVIGGRRHPEMTKIYDYHIFHCLRTRQMLIGKQRQNLSYLTKKQQYKILNKPVECKLSVDS